MLKSGNILTEDLYTIDWSKFNCQAIFDEVTERLKIVCEIQPEHQHLASPREGDPPKQTKQEKGAREEWDNMIGI